MDILNDGPARAELERIGAARGLVDPDALKLADLSSVTVDADGKVTGAAEAIEKLKQSKSYLFAAPAKPKRASELTDAELARGIQDLDRGPSAPKPARDADGKFKPATRRASEIS